MVVRLLLEETADGDGESGSRAARGVCRCSVGMGEEWSFRAGEAKGPLIFRGEKLASTGFEKLSELREEE